MTINFIDRWTIIGLMHLKDGNDKREERCQSVMI